MWEADCHYQDTSLCSEILLYFKSSSQNNAGKEEEEHNQHKPLQSDTATRCYLCALEAGMSNTVSTKGIRQQVYQ